MPRPVAPISTGDALGRCDELGGCGYPRGPCPEAIPKRGSTVLEVVAVVAARQNKQRDVVAALVERDLVARPLGDVELAKGDHHRGGDAGGIRRGIADVK